MARVWIELPPGPDGDMLGWGDTALIKTALAEGEDGVRGYVVEEIRGQVHMLRLSGSKLDSSELWAMPGGRLWGERP